MSLLSGGGGLVLGGFGLLVLAVGLGLGLGVWLAVQRGRGGAVAAGPAVALPLPPVRAAAGAAPSPVQTEIAAHLQRLAEARAIRAPGRPPAAPVPAEQVPLPPAAAMPTAAAPASAAAAPRAPRAPVVLVADGARIARVRLSRLLAPLGWVVREAADGEAALAALRAAPADLLITDAGLPGLDGLALTRALRADPALAGLPVVLLTADDDRQRDEAARAGVTVLIGQPYGEAALLAHVRRLCPGPDAAAAPAHGGWHAPAGASRRVTAAAPSGLFRRHGWPDWAVPDLFPGHPAPARPCPTTGQEPMPCPSTPS